jgi:hypothetical protein
MSVLVVYYYAAYPLRASVRDHLYSFRRHSRHTIAYLNLATTEVPADILRTPFDAVIFHTAFLSARWSLELFAQLVERIRVLKAMPAVGIALPQDEFIHTDVLCDFIREFQVAHVFSVAPPSEWPTIYASVDRQAVRFHEVLTGYLEDDTVRRIERLAARAGRRTIDIGYRAWRAEPWLGRHGFLKTQVAELFTARAPAHRLTTDISTKPEDTILGDDWYHFLLRCKYTIGAEGGASILDRDGAIRERTNEYTAKHPGAPFEQVEAACFPGRDGGLALFAVSPRHLEACATRTCQVLVEGRYNGALEAGAHYIPLARDFSNTDDVLRLLARDTDRAKITERAYQDVVASGRYSYRTFVSTVLDAALETAPRRTPIPRRVLLRYRWAERRGWTRMALRTRVAAPAVHAINATARAILPRPVRMLIHAAIGAVRGLRARTHV